jgi:sarcosine oxidase, subunit beta
MDLPRHVDIVVIGAGVIGCSVAWHLATLGAGQRVLLLDRGQVGSGTSAQSSGILRTHYSVPQNVDLARRSWAVFDQFSQVLDDTQASAGLVRSGYLIVAPPGEKSQALDAALAAQAAQGIEVHRLDAVQAKERLPIAQFDGGELIGYEPQAGFADPYLTASSFARAARRHGVLVREGVAVQALRIEGQRVTGVLTDQGPVATGCVVSAQNIWAAHDVQRWTGLSVPLVAERHRVLALAGPSPYLPTMPVFKDLASPGMLYARCYGGTQMLVSEGTAGEVLAQPSAEPGDVSMDLVAHIGEQVAQRFPGWEEAGLASSWTGVYDVTPDWNPVLGSTPDLDGLIVGFGFSGHGFKLSPAVGKLLAQCALGLPTDIDLRPYAWQRFERGQLLRGRYGAGAVS